MGPDFRDFKGTTMIVPPQTEELYHFGIKGMRWGYNDGKLNGGRVARQESRENRSEEYLKIANEYKQEMEDIKQEILTTGDMTKIEDYSKYQKKYEKTIKDSENSKKAYKLDYLLGELGAKSIEGLSDLVIDGSKMIGDLLKDIGRNIGNKKGE